MKRTIKFRGRAISDSCGVSVDKIVRGDLIHEWNKVSIFDDDDGDIYEIAPESVAQFVGVDKNGHEVYEGDTVDSLDDMNYPRPATFRDFGAIIDGKVFLEIR